MPEPMTPERIAEIEARANAASDGPWRVYANGESVPGYDVIERIVSDAWTGRGASEGPSDEDARFIARSREDVPALLAEVKRLQDQRAAVLELAARAEHGAVRWEHPLPVPEWVERVRSALGAEGASAEEEGGPAVGDPDG